MGILSIIAFIILGTIIGMLLTSSKFGEQYGGGIALTFVTIGFALGSRSFLSHVVGSVTFQGFSGVPDIKLVKGKNQIGIKNLTVAKILVSVAIWILIYILFISLIFIISGSNPGDMPDSMVLVFLFGLVLGPFLGILAFRRSTFPTITQVINSTHDQNQFSAELETEENPE